MKYSTIFWRIFLVLFYPALIASLLLYFYPAFWSCEFPGPPLPDLNNLANAEPPKNGTWFMAGAPFRLLVLADPQLEGDSSLPDLDLPRFPSWSKLRSGGYSGDGAVAAGVATALKDFVVEDIPLLLASYRKRLDLIGNDYYLAHIYRSLNSWVLPTHVVVLGDLIGSQWVSDGEFDWRGWRYWNRVFSGARRVEDSIMNEKARQEVLGEDQQWARRIINIAGNHDIGYAGDTDEKRIERFRRIFGLENWSITFQLPQSPDSAATPDDTISAKPPPELRLIILNSMNIDGPVLSPSLQTSTYDFMNANIQNARPVGDNTAATILLTHIPLHKAAGLCVDAPFFDYGPHGIKEQNHLSASASKNILEGIYGMSDHPDAPARGMGRRGVILNGHDHAGCDVYHYVDVNVTEEAEDVWKATRWGSAAHLVESEDVPGIREITVRSMMGAYGGNAGLFSAWFDEKTEAWRFEYATCSLGVQHLWWGVHIWDVVTWAVLVATGICMAYEEFSDRRRVAFVKKRQ